ncbi:uncharacterized protein Z518_03576 [Rhinocladiella mackenziei CBS 650.93]|uniref:Cytochrome P450 n=1 Tax=Rhinocladiella mackenziei CBS 650.93 TaxID=1442369 RepID=A0A0D2ISF3_9EURO|nr:uncharacterized protein Z518_03576 [Rhinocladiella mackenziei CBS 650.93]KIX08919.1 hypothetical protein Z518_03576 [Rhinocladiella mackenziei CBS 650.93]
MFGIRPPENRSASLQRLTTLNTQRGDVRWHRRIRCLRTSCRGVRPADRGYQLGTVPPNCRRNWIRNPVSKFLPRFLGKDNVNAYPNFFVQADQRIRERRARGIRDRRDMLQQFFEAKTVPISHPDVLSEAANALGAHADTTSIGIKACLGYLLLNPDKYRVLQKELDRSWLEKDLPTDEITYNQCLEIPILQAIIKESTRLHPSIIFQLPRYVPPSGITIRDHVLPGGTHVSMSPWIMNRSREVFGPDAHEWRPKRWLEDPEKAKYMDGLLATFGYGSTKSLAGVTRDC